MARTGTIERRQGRWYAKLSLGDGRRKKVALPRGISEAMARNLAEKMAEDLAAGVFVPPPPRGGATATAGDLESVEQWCTRWCRWRREKGYSSVKDDEGRLKNHVFAEFGSRPIKRVTRKDIERLVEKLDAKALAGEISWKTAVNVWAVVTKMFKDACRSKLLSLRAREDNPCTDVEGPDRGGAKAKCFLYPSEFIAFVTCEKVPLLWRRLVAVAVYLGVRAGELEALEWDDIDIEHGKVTIHRSIDREDGATKGTKSEETRPFGLEPNLMPLLWQMCVDAGGKGRVFPGMPRPRDLAEKLRDYLKLAGVTRAELFISDATRINLRWHDLRASTVTWMAVRGETAEKIMQRVGHEDWDTMKKYLRTAEALAVAFGEVFPALPPGLLGAGVPSALSPFLPNLPKQQRGGRDSNPRPPA